MAPEVRAGEVYDGRKADVFSSGVILFIIVHGIFPFKEARALAIKNMIDAKLPLSSSLEQPLPYQSLDDVEPQDLVQLPPEVDLPRFKITQQRLLDYGETQGCPACESGLRPGQLHTLECRHRFLEALRKDGVMPDAPKPKAPDLPVEFPAAAPVREAGDEAAHLSTEAIDALLRISG